MPFSHLCYRVLSCLQILTQYIEETWNKSEKGGLGVLPHESFGFDNLKYCIFMLFLPKNHSFTYLKKLILEKIGEAKFDDR